MFLRLFGVCCGLLCVAIGLFVFVGAQAGPVCRVNCGLHVAIIQLLGQTAYNVATGTFGMVVGGWLVFASFRLGRQNGRRKQKKRRRRQ